MHTQVPFGKPNAQNGREYGDIKCCLNENMKLNQVRQLHNLLFLLSSAKKEKKEGYKSFF